MEKPDLVIDKKHNLFFLNGEIKGAISPINKEKEKYMALIFSGDEFENVQVLDIFNQGVNVVRMHLQEVLHTYFKWISITLSRVKFEKEGFNTINLEIDLNHWNYKFSIKSFFGMLDEVLTKEDVLGFKVNEIDDFNDVFGLGLKLNLFLDTKLYDIKELDDKITEILKLKFDTVIAKLTQKNNSNLKNTFTFPPEIQNSCEQYLIYFATFLKDIGINAETNIESKTHETLFTVIPANGEEALEKIKEALQMYLSLPESPEFETVASEFTDVGVQQLLFQVNNFKSQLMYANATLQLKDEIIQSKQISIDSLQLTNYQQKEIIQSHQANEENEEKLAGDLVKVNEVKVIGFTFDLPELLRRIKRKLK